MNKVKEFSEDLTLLDEEAEIQDPDMFFEILKGRSPTGRFDYQSLLDLHKMPRLNKTYMPPKEGDAFIFMESGINLSRLEELCKADLPRPDLHISGDDPALNIRKHPLMFKITDLVEDPEEFKRLRARLERSDEAYQFMGVRKHPIYVEAIPDANILARTADETMKELMKLCREFNVDIYFGTKQALKPIMWAWMYGAHKKDLNLSEVEEISVEKAKEFLAKTRKVAIVGGGGINGLVKRIIAEQHGLSVCVDSFDTWNFKDFANVAKLDKPPRDWEQGRLRRGKGHNKFKRKGKK